MDPIQNEIARLVRELRTERGWTQADVANRTGMTQSRVSAAENPTGPLLSIRTLARLAAAFGVGLEVRFVPLSGAAPEREDG
jgi:transcriptional regulator with XRE-family HTH domain